jgi:hypothetical protein
LPEGGAESVQFLFIEYRCIECHTLDGTEFTEEFEREVLLNFGGESTVVKAMAI